MNKYDIDLFLKLNEEYRSKPVKSIFTEYTEDFQLRSAEKRVNNLSQFFEFKNKRILEVGCGRGFLVNHLRNEFQCDAVGVDIIKYDEWSNFENSKKIFFDIDLNTENPFSTNSFDLIISFAVFEHVKDPFSLLKVLYDLLKPEGSQYIVANQYRSSIGSHLYREVFFPYPHLLFHKDVINEYFEKHVEQNSFTHFMRENFFINKLTYSHYKDYFEQIGYQLIFSNFKTRELDMDFYNRFLDMLSMYPISDLTLDFFEVVLKKSAKQDTNQISQIIKTYNTRINDYENQIQGLQQKVKEKNKAIKDYSRELNNLERNPILYTKRFIKKIITRIKNLIKNK